ncbi:protocadherin-1-like [Mercenaria mercenaria]|uniref:protocadherin-1-like n=1 Tax=Mercenaria mercenaria TaxID=6596 RepID=UPI00234E980A|nr:protocadherin-1-like [Mercenaria mercenaria]
MMTWIPVALLAIACFFQEGDAAITAWTEPTINSAASGTGSYSFAENIATGTGGVSKTIAATGTGTMAYTLLTSGTPFSIASATGVLSLDTALDYETTTTYTIEIRAVDSASPAGSGTATITVTVTDVNEAPTFTAAAFGVCISDASTAGTTLTTVTATDQDSGDTITYSIAGDSTNTDFSIASTGVITVATGKTLAASTTAAYALQIEAADNDGTPLTGTTTVGVLVQACSSGSAALLASSVLVLMMGFTMLLK